MQSDGATQRLARQITEARDLEGFLSANRHKFAPETIAGLKEEVDRLIESDPRRAEPLARATRSAAEMLDDPVSLGYGDAAIARVHHFEGKFADAEQLYEAAIGRLRGAGRPREAAALERQLVALLMRLGKASEGLALARRARRVLARSGDTRLLAQLENNVSNIYYFVLERYRTALAHLDRAKALFEEAGDTRSLAFVEYNRAAALRELDRPHEAIELYERAEQMLAAEGLKRAAAQASYAAGYTLAVIGRYGDALRKFHSARDRAAEFGDRVLAAMTNNCLADLYLRLNVSDEADARATAALEELLALEADEPEIARARLVRAQVFERYGDYGRASEELSQAQAIFDGSAMPVLGAGAGLLRANLALAAGDAALAARLAADSAKRFARARLPLKRAWARLVEARGARALGERGRALRLAKLALKAGTRDRDPWLECSAEELVGELELELGRREAGVAALERAVAGIERLRLGIRPGEARAAFLGDKLSPYERLVGLNLEGGGPEGLRRAFRYVEMAKSRALADLMGQYLTAPSQAAPSKREGRLRQQLARGLEELSWYSSRLDRESEKGEQRNTRLDAHLRGEMVRCERALASLYRRLEVEDADLADLFVSEPVGVEELAADLAADEVVVEYFVAGESVSAFVVTAEGARAFAGLTTAERVERHLSGLRFQFEKFALGRRYTDAHETALRRCVDHHLAALHRELIAPLGDALEGRRVVFIPHGILHYVPMHALKGPGGYLIERHDVSYSPSATVFRLCLRRDAAPEAKRDLLAVGLSDGQTPHITGELAAIGDLFSESTLLEGSEARKSAFLDKAPGNRFLHLATHGSFRKDNPMFSSVRLADGPLNFYDVFDLGLDAELVTLSACNTGINDLSPGDELCGLMRGFLHAGVPSLVVSLWAVNDGSTSELMQSFYRQLRAGADKRRALRLAQLEVLERYGHPYYWAPFVLMGKP